jgi:hypothetical protein
MDENTDSPISEDDWGAAVQSRRKPMPLRQLQRRAKNPNRQQTLRYLKNSAQKFD